MPRNPRVDYPGALHHITNRGIAKRPIFERIEDVRYFLSRIAHAVRRGEIRLYSFSLITTHFHLFLLSVRGCLGRAMQRIQGEYARYFNRRRKRDGSLYRGRYFANVVETTAYGDNVVRYIDGNAVMAGLVADPAWHAASSAYWYARPEGPPWLDRSVLERRAVERCGASAYGTEIYAQAFRPRYSESYERWILDRHARGEQPPDPLDDLITAAPPKVLAWMRRKAELADGPRPAVGIPLVPWEDLQAAVSRRSDRLDALDEHPRQGASLTEVALAGLLRDVGGLTYREIAHMTGVTAPAASYRAGKHRKLLALRPYGACVAAIVKDALQELL